MLAYIFWHWRNPQQEKAAYQRHLIDFHETLRAHKPAGFQYSAVFEAAHLPWAGPSGEAYEDWYVVDNSAALDVLNEAAVSGPCEEPHQRAARWAAGGAGGLYRLHDGEPDLATARIALCFAKPSAMTYAALYENLQAEIKLATGSLWRRQMVLGPAPEFRWHSPQDHKLPAIFDCLKVPLTRVWLG